MPNIVGARDRDPPEAAADVSPAPATKDTAPASPETALKRSRLVKSAVRPAPAMAADVRKRPRENAAFSLVRRPKRADTRAPINKPSRVGGVHGACVGKTPAEISSHRWK